MCDKTGLEHNVTWGRMSNQGSVELLWNGRQARVGRGVGWWCVGGWPYDECIPGFQRLARSRLSPAEPHHFLWPCYPSRGVKSSATGTAALPRERERERGRESEGERERVRERGGKREREGEREGGREKRRDRDRERKINTEERRKVDENRKIETEREKKRERERVREHAKIQTPTSTADSAMFPPGQPS